MDYGRVFRLAIFMHVREHLKFDLSDPLSNYYKIGGNEIISRRYYARDIPANLTIKGINKQVTTILV